MAQIGKQKGDAIAIPALAIGKTKKEAAVESGLSRRTLDRRTSDPRYMRLVEQARAEIQRRQVAKLSAAGDQAIDTLIALLNAASESVRLQAARTITEMGIRRRENEEYERKILDVEERLAELEAERSGLHVHPRETEESGQAFAEQA